MSDQAPQVTVQTKYKLQVVLGLALLTLAAILAFTDLNVWLIIGTGAVGLAVFISGALGASADVKRDVRASQRESGQRDSGQ